MGKRKSFIGIVISDKMKKTIIVRVTNISKHPKYGKIMKSYSKFKVHDEKDQAKAGDMVGIEETRPLSKDKHFRLIEVIKKAKMPHADIEEQV